MTPADEALAEDAEGGERASDREEPQRRRQQRQQGTPRLGARRTRCTGKSFNATTSRLTELNSERRWMHCTRM